MAAHLSSLLGTFLSIYDETAMDGAARLKAMLISTPALADTFLGERQVTDAFVKLLGRKGDIAVVFDACALLVGGSGKAQRMGFIRQLLDTAPRQRLRTALDRVDQRDLPTTVAALELLTVLVKFSAKQVFARFGQAVPLQLASLTADRLFHNQAALRPARTALLVQYLESHHCPEVAAKAAVQHGFATKLLEDCAELAKGGHMELVRRVLRAFTAGVIASGDLSATAKRDVFSGQHSVVRSIVALLAVEDVVEPTAALLRKIVLQVAEPLRNYAVSRDADDARMPNFPLLLLLRALRPKQRAVDAHLVVFTLCQAPELVRPYIARVSRHLLDADSSVSLPRGQVAVCNVLTRLFAVPLPYHITSRSATLLPSTAAPRLFFDLTPIVAADEAVPVWFGEFAHKILTDDKATVLMTCFAMQAAHACLARLINMKREFAAIRAVRTGGGGDDAVDAGAAWQSFSAELDAELTQRLPSIEVVRKKLNQLVFKALTAGPDATPADESKLQFALQRAYLLLHLYVEAFNLRTPFAASLPAPAAAWRADVPEACFAAWQPDTVRAMCALLLANLTRNVKLARLHHITFGEAKLDALKAPPLLELLYWFDDARQRPAPSASLVAAQRSVCHVVLWVVHSVSLRFAVGEEEMLLWLRALPRAAAAVFVHFINHMQQAGSSRTTSTAATDAPHGVLAAAAHHYVARTQEKLDTRDAAKDDVWLADVRASLGAFAQCLAAVEAQWETRDAAFAAALPAAAAPTGAAAEESAEALAAAQQRVMKTAIDDLERVSAPARVVRFVARAEEPPTTETPSGAAAVPFDVAALQDTKPKRWAKALLADRAWLGDTGSVWRVADALNTAFKPACRYVAEGEADAEHAVMAAQAAKLIDALADEEGAAQLVRDIAASAGELHGVGVALLVFVCVRTVVVQDADVDTAAAQKLLLRMYNGTMAVADRICFAALALLEPRKTARHADPAAAGDEDAEVTSSSGASSMDGVANHSPACLTALRNARFVIGDNECAANRVPEVEALAALVDSWVDANITEQALQMPLHVVTPTPAEASASPLALIFADSANRMARRNAHLREDAEADSVAKHADPRFLLPLAYTVSALRYRKAAAVQSALVTRLLPFFMRAMSFQDIALRRLATNCLALVHASLHATRRCVVNALRLQLLRLLGSATPRLLAVHSAFYVLAIPVVGNAGHPLHARVERALLLDDDHSVPLEALLSAYPSSCVVGLPSKARPQDLERTAELAHVLTQLRYSCASWADFAYLTRRSVLQLLMANVALLGAFPDLRAALMAALRAVANPHVEEIAVQAAVKARLVEWALTYLSSLTTAVAARAFDGPATEVLALLVPLYRFFRTNVNHHAQTASVVLHVLAYARDAKVLSAAVLSHGLQLLGLAQMMAPSVALVAAEERAAARAFLATAAAGQQNDQNVASLLARLNRAIA
jgi:hypothetical protein